MSYFTGTASTSTDLKVLIEAKAVLAGWTLLGGWLSKGINNVYLTVPDNQTLSITGANSSDGTVQPFGSARCIWVQSSEWPVTYYLHLNTTPDMIVLVIKHATNRIQTLMFGDIVKIHTSAYVGGNFFFASLMEEFKTAENSFLRQITNTIIQCGTGGFTTESNIIPFSHSYDAARNTPIHIELDTNIWDVPNPTPKVTYTDTTISSLFRSPNTYNSQTHLVPMNLQYGMANNLFGYLGYVEHVRLVRIDNYEIGDIITISPDQWKVYPWFKKNTLNRNGINIANSGTGTLGFAVRYTP